MKKIMFNETYRLQTAVLERWKTMTRRQKKKSAVTCTTSLRDAVWKVREETLTK